MTARKKALHTKMRATATLAAVAALGLAALAVTGASLSDVERYYFERGDLARYVLWKVAIVAVVAALVFNLRAIVGGGRAPAWVAVVVAVALGAALGGAQRTM